MMRLVKSRKNLRQSPKNKIKEGRNVEAVVQRRKESIFSRFLQGTLFKPTSTTEEHDTLLENATSEFERQLIRDCRADGMSDGEICKWLKQL